MCKEVFNEDGFSLAWLIPYSSLKKSDCDLEKELHVSIVGYDPDLQ
jgi:hypothetical protein